MASWCCPLGCPHPTPEEVVEACRAWLDDMVQGGHVQKNPEDAGREMVKAWKSGEIEPFPRRK